MATGCVYEMYSNNVTCNRTYIGSTTGNPRGRLASHKYKKHPIFQFGQVDVRVLEPNVPASELRKREGDFIRERRGSLFNLRVAGRTQREKYHENIEASRAYQRSQYVPKKDGNEGSYRQLDYYKENSERILRRLCLKNARARGTPPTPRSVQKYAFTDEELARLL